MVMILQERQPPIIYKTITMTDFDEIIIDVAK